MALDSTYQTGFKNTVTDYWSHNAHTGYPPKQKQDAIWSGRTMFHDQDYKCNIA